jgi:hypothetical protein
VPGGTVATRRYRVPVSVLLPIQPHHPSVIAFARGPSRVELRGEIEQAGGPGIRDADEILHRIRQDEAEADDARIRYRVEGLPIIDVDGLAGEHFRPAETVVDIRTSTVVTRHLLGEGTDVFAGRLVLTTQRLLLVGHAPLEVELGEIDELTLAGERLLLTLRDGTGLSIDASRPRLLRVQIAAAREAAGT